MAAINTILAIVAGIIFYNEQLAWPLVGAVFAGIVQLISIRTMKAQAISNLRLGMDDYTAIHATSDTFAHIAMLASVVIWGLFAYSIFIYFG